MNQSLASGTRRNFFRTGAAGAAGTLLSASPTHSSRGFITDVDGIQVGHWTSTKRPTGCTAILFDGGAVAGVDVRGSAPGTRETDLLNPLNTVQRVNAILLSGGSAYGLDAATGVMRYLEERKQGFPVGQLVVPIVPAAILFDLGVGDGTIRPDAEAGYQAAKAAATGPVVQGNVGAGAGATVGKAFGMARAMKSGLGTASVRVGDTGIVVGALVAVNAVGDVIDPSNGSIVAGARDTDGKSYANTMAQILNGHAVRAKSGTNTTIGVVATNARFEKVHAAKIAQMAHDGLARAIKPVHTSFDGDTVFAACTGKTDVRAEVGAIGAIAAEVMAQAIVQAVEQASGIAGLPAARDLKA